MELYKEILIKALESEKINVVFPEFTIDADKIVEQECYQALNRIKEIINDDTLEDEECFAQIEGIICVLEDVGSGGGVRHDFG